MTRKLSLFIIHKLEFILKNFPEFGVGVFRGHAENKNGAMDPVFV